MADQTRPGFPIEKMALPVDCPECGSRIDDTSAHGRCGVGEKPDLGIITADEAQKQYGIAYPRVGDEIFWASVDAHCTADDCTWRAETMAARIAP